MHEQKQFGVYVGRFNPIHLGHEQVIQSMIDECGENNCLLIIGSSNKPQSFRHFFGYANRKHFIQLLFPYLSIVGLPDYEDNTDWFSALDDIIMLSGNSTSQVDFFTGCKEDVLILSRYVSRFKIFNRFDGTTPTISATGVRDALLHQRSLDGLINPKIQSELQSRFNDVWATFQNI
jgi:cytidyltransferase-like protein